MLSADGRLRQPTQVAESRRQALALQAANDSIRNFLDDATQRAEPRTRSSSAAAACRCRLHNTLRGGDKATGIVGVLNYTWAGNSASGNAYRERPVRALDGYCDFEPANPRPRHRRPTWAARVQVVDMNLLNYFNTFKRLHLRAWAGAPGRTAAAPTSRSNSTGSGRRPSRLFLRWIPTCWGVNELEIDGYGPDSALQYLVDRLNEATAPGTYAFIDVDAVHRTTQRAGHRRHQEHNLTEPAKVTPTGQTAALNTVEFVNGGNSTPGGRPSLAQAFVQNDNGA